MTMEMRCQDVPKIVHPYLDGEFEAADRLYLEKHLAECAACREMVAFEAAFKANLRARLHRTPAPPELRAGVLAALDRADAVGDGPVRGIGRRLLPYGAALAVAAAAVLIIGQFVQARATRSPIVTDAINGHEKQLPVEIAGDEGRVKSWMVGKVPVSVRPPRGGGATLVGARMGHVRDRDAAQLLYTVGGSNVTVYVFDASGMPMDSARKRLVAGNREVYVDSARGYNVVFYRDRDVGYAFTSDLGEDEMLRLVSASFEDE